MYSLLCMIRFELASTSDVEKKKTQYVSCVNFSLLQFRAIVVACNGAAAVTSGRMRTSSRTHLRVLPSHRRGVLTAIFNRGAARTKRCKEQPVFNQTPFFGRDTHATAGRTTAVRQRNGNRFCGREECDSRALTFKGFRSLFLPGFGLLPSVCWRLHCRRRRWPGATLGFR